MDSREAALFQTLTRMGADVSHTQLEIGDIHIRDSAKEVLLIFERKTLADLAASIKDSRYKEQKMRMLAAVPAKHITYIIEGGCANPVDAHGLSRSTLLGVFIHSMYRDGVHVVHVPNLEGTAQWILDVAAKVQARVEYFAAGGAPATEYVNTLRVKSRRQDNLDPRTVYLLQLAQIPGVSIRIAESIAERYPNMPSLITALAESTEPSTFFREIPMIGPKKSAQIAAYLKQ